MSRTSSIWRFYNLKLDFEINLLLKTEITYIIKKALLINECLRKESPFQCVSKWVNQNIREIFGNKKSQPPDKQTIDSYFSSGNWTRTSDLRVMSPTSYLLLYPAILNENNLLSF